MQGRPATPRISAVIITRNEERRLPACLSALAFADEIVVLDSGSTDRTREIATEHGAIVSSRDFDDFPAQKNHAIEQASGDWILSVDADEIVPAELAEELLAAGFQSAPYYELMLGAAVIHAAEV